ncbi:MAG TPA: hypothetical protein VHO28_15450 [Ignavibacteriales bacterium]|nr:hypothetical protein [Ignavibacteriales bacterium]
MKIFKSFAEEHYPGRVGVKEVYYGEEITMEINVEEIKTSSFTLSCGFKGADGEVRLKTKTVHVFIAKRTGAKTEIPYVLKDKLKEHLLR